jgi:surface antigen Omp85-like protein
MPRCRTRRRTAACTLLAALLAAVAASAQEPETREAELRRQREEKATTLSPYRPSGAERLLLWLENGRTWERLLNPAEGFYPKIGTITAGSGLGMGAGYRRPRIFAGDRGAVSVVAMGSLKKYWVVDARLTLPEVADGAVVSEVYARESDYPREAFFGLGPESRRGAKSEFGLRTGVAGIRASVRRGRFFSVGGRAERLAVDVHRAPSASIEDRFAAPDIPGADQQPTFGHYEIFAEVNAREPRGNPRVGGLYALRYERFDDRGAGAFDFDRVEGEVQQYVSVFNQRRVVALRGLVSTSSADPGAVVPFYLDRTLGGPDDLRGFRRNRFRDAHLILLQAEYRWEVFTAMDAAIFYDAGKVAARRKDLDFNGLEHDYGFGVRFGTDNGVFLRVEGAFGSRDGKHLVLRFGDVF